MKNLKDPWKKRTHSLKMQLKRVSLSQRTQTLRQYSLPTFCKNSHTLSISPDNDQIPLYTSIKTHPWCIMSATNVDIQKQDADEKQFVEILEKKTTQMTKQINAQMNLSV